MIKARMLAALAAVVALTGIAVPAASASSHSPRSMEQLIAAVRADPNAPMTATEQARFREYVRLDHFTTVTIINGQIVTPDEPMSTARLKTVPGAATPGLGTSSWHHKAITYGRDAGGYRLFSYWVEGTWTGDGLVTNTAHNDQVSGTAIMVGWSYKGNLMNRYRVTQGAYSQWVDGPVGRMFGQGKFDFLWKGVAQQSTPCLRINGYGDGAYHDDYKCSYYD